jgi:hypothetical protein
MKKFLIQNAVFFDRKTKFLFTLFLQKKVDFLHSSLLSYKMIILENKLIFLITRKYLISEVWLIGVILK